MLSHRPPLSLLLVRWSQSSRSPMPSRHLFQMGVTLLLWVRTRWLSSTPAGEAAVRWAEGPGRAWVIICSQGTASWSLTGGDPTPTCIFATSSMSTGGPQREWFRCILPVLHFQETTNYRSINKWHICSFFSQ